MHLKVANVEMIITNWRVRSGDESMAWTQAKAYCVKQSTHHVIRNTCNNGRV